MEYSGTWVSAQGPVITTFLGLRTNILLRSLLHVRRHISMWCPYILHGMCYYFFWCLWRDRGQSCGVLGVTTIVRSRHGCFLNSLGWGLSFCHQIVDSKISSMTVYNKNNNLLQEKWFKNTNFNVVRQTLHLCQLNLYLNLRNKCLQSFFCGEFFECPRPWRRSFIYRFRAYEVSV